MQDLFAYGTLMSEEIIKSVIGFVPEKKQGTITGFRRHAIKNAHYPGVKPAQDSCVEGVIYLNIDQESWRRLDLFEGDMYYRQEAVVVLDDGVSTEAEVYVVKPEFFSRLADHDWSFSRFRESGKAYFVESYDGFGFLID